MARAVFMGSDQFSVPVLETLLTGGEGLSIPVTTVGVVTQPDRPAGRGRKPASSPVKAMANQYGVPLLQFERVRAPEAQSEILALEPDVIVVASFGQLLPESLLSAPTRKAINLHPSLLPLFRGPSPVLSAILQGEGETGTTLMLMTAKMDSGPILAQEQTSIGQNETGGELEARLARLSAELLARCLPDWLAGAIEPRPQNDLLATYTARVTKEDGRINWTLPAEYLARMARAFNPWPVAYTYWEGRQVRVLRASSREGMGAPGQALGLYEGALACGTGDGILLIEQMQLPGGKPLSPEELARGHPNLLDARFS